jgi:hypothetical protein
MPDEELLHSEALVMPIHLQYSYFDRDEIPLHNMKNSRDMGPNLVSSITSKKLEVPSHVVLNQAICQNNINESKGISSVAITQRISRSKFMTLIYYKGTDVSAT